MNINSIQQRSGNLSHILLNLSRVAGTFLLGIPIVAAATGLRCQSTGGVTLLAPRPNPQKYPKKPISLGDHLRAKRLGLKLTQLTASQILGVDEMTLCNWENKRSNPMLHLLPKLIEFLGYDPMIVKTKTVGERILQYRKSRGITQKELARQIGIDPTTLSRLGREKKGVFPHILEKVSSFLTAHVLDGGVVKR